MSFPRPRPAVCAWLGLTGYIVAADAALVLLGKDECETMSSAFRDAVRHPVHRWPIIVLWAYVTGHLFLEIPGDPLTQLGKTVEILRQRGVQAP